MRRVPLFLAVFPFILGCGNASIDLTREGETVISELGDCLMKVVDDESARVFAEVYFPKLKARSKVIKDRLDNVKKVWDKKDKQIWKEWIKESGYFERVLPEVNRVKYQTERIKLIEKAVKKEIPEEELVGFPKCIESKWGEELISNHLVDKGDIEEPKDPEKK